jgi:hypothetical protein
MEALSAEPLVLSTEHELILNFMKHYMNGKFKELIEIEIVQRMFGSMTMHDMKITFTQSFLEGVVKELDIDKLKFKKPLLMLFIRYMKSDKLLLEISYPRCY